MDRNVLTDELARQVQPVLSLLIYIYIYIYI